MNQQILPNKEINLDPYTYNLIYIYTRPSFPDYCKIGKASIFKSEITNDEDLKDNSKKLMEAAIKRIKEQTRTASIKFDCKYASLAIQNNQIFQDTNFHEFLNRLGFQKDSPEKDENGQNIGDE